MALSGRLRKSIHILAYKYAYIHKYIKIKTQTHMKKETHFKEIKPFFQFQFIPTVFSCFFISHICMSLLPQRKFWFPKTSYLFICPLLYLKQSQNVFINTTTINKITKKSLGFISSSHRFPPTPTHTFIHTLPCSYLKVYGQILCSLINLNLLFLLLFLFLFPFQKIYIIHFKYNLFNLFPFAFRFSPPLF